MIQTWLATSGAKLILAGVMALIVAVAAWMARGHWDASTLAKLKAEHAAYVVTAEKAARASADKALAQQAALIASTQEVVNDARKITQDLERSIAVSDSASRGLLDSAARAATRCSPSPTTPAAIGSPATKLPGSMSDGDRFLRVLGELDGFAGSAAADSGRSRAAVAACNAAYNQAMKAVNQ